MTPGVGRPTKLPRGLVTRNQKDFRAAPVATADPPTVLALL
jgi:hypothetical protein